MILLAGLFLWMLAFAAVKMARRSPGLWSDRPIRRRAAWLVVTVVVFLLFFRPQENFLGGEDPGSYLNSALRYAREGSLFYTDPLLAEVPLQDRAWFLYGTPAFGQTKAAALWVHDLATARMGPWFQPAYPLLMATVARLGPDFWVFYVAPFFALLMGWMVARLAREVVHERAALPAFVFFAFNPVIAWNARCPRPELPAGFFLLAGLLFFLRAWPPRGRPTAKYLLLSAVCLGVAPFFHITAWMTVVAAALLACGLAAVTRRALFLLIPSAVSIAAGFFLLQLVYVTDCYFLLRFLEPLGIAPWFLGAALVGGGALFSAVLWGLTVTRARDTAPTPDVPGRWERAHTGRLLGAGCLVMVVLIFLFRDAKGTLPFLPPSLSPYIILTDFRGVVTLMSMLALALALLGWLALLARPGPAAPQRAMLAFCLLPGTLCAGWMNNYMFETRRLVMVLAPWLAIGLAAAVTATFRRDGSRRRFVTFLLCLLVLTGFVRGKLLLYTTTDLKGLVAFFEGFADRVRKADGILLTEYAQFAAPFDHYFGIPGLSLDSDHRDDHQVQRAEAAWADLMQSRQQDPVFFLTPFQPPISDRFTFVPVMEGRHTTTTLPRARRQAPSTVRERVFSLGLYGMALSSPGAPSPAVTFPYNRVIDGSKMGYRGWANLRTRNWPVPGRIAGPHGAITLAMEEGEPGREMELLLFFLAAPGSPVAPEPALDPSPTRFSWYRLAADWWLCQATISTPAAGQEIAVRPGEHLLLTDAYIRAPGATVQPLPLDTGGVPAEWSLPGLTARWTREEAQTLMPLPPSRHGMLAFLAHSSRPDQSSVDVTVSAEQGAVAPVSLAVPARWRWHVVDCHDLSGSSPCWFTLGSTPVWDPQSPQYPHDLGILVSSFSMIPASGGANLEELE